jgi:5-formyltetrahydrofolate cyclo-ligase
VEDAQERAEAVGELLATIPVAGVDEPRVLSYLSFIDEPDTSPLHALVRERGFGLSLVRLLPDRGLDVVAWDAGTALVDGPRGTRAPAGPALDPATVHLAVVPALAVDPVTGVRLGRGGGSYDRLLDTLAAPVVALLRSPEELRDLRDVAEPHDRAVDAVALPRGIVRI